MRYERSKHKYDGKIVDIHCHVLPDVDDGAATFDQSINMLKISITEGTIVVVATPHFVCDGSEKLYTAKIQQASETLKTLVAQNGIPIKVVLGYELLLSNSLLHIDNIQDYVIEGTNRIMVEPHLSEPPEDLDELIYELEHYNVGLILAHPERNEWLACNISYLHELARRGVLLQVNAGSITGSWGRGVARTARKFAGEGLIHLIGSDAHSDSGRGPFIKEALSMLSGWIDQRQVESIAYKRAEMIFRKDEIDNGEAYGMLKM